MKDQNTATRGRKPKVAKVTKRYNVVLPAELLDQLQEVAEEHHTTTLELIKRFIKLGLLVVRAQKTPDLEFLVRENGVESRLWLV